MAVLLLDETPAVESMPSICSMRRCCCAAWAPASGSSGAPTRVDASSSGMALNLAETTAQSALRDEAQATSYCQDSADAVAVIVEFAATESSPDEGMVDLGTRSSTMARSDKTGAGAGEEEEELW